MIVIARESGRPSKHQSRDIDEPVFTGAPPSRGMTAEGLEQEK